MSKSVIANRIINLPRDLDLKFNTENKGGHDKIKQVSEYDSHSSKNSSPKVKLIEKKKTFMTLYPRFEIYWSTLKSAVKNKTTQSSQDTVLTIHKKNKLQKYDSYLEGITQNVKLITKAITKSQKVKIFNKILERKKPGLKSYHHIYDLTTAYRGKENKTFNLKMKEFTHGSPVHITQTYDRQTDTYKLVQPMVKQTETRRVTSHKIITESPKNIKYKDNAKVLEIHYKEPNRFLNGPKSIVDVKYLQLASIPKNEIRKRKLLSIGNIYPNSKTFTSGLAFFKRDFSAELRGIKRRGNLNNMIKAYVDKPVSHLIKQPANELNGPKPKHNEEKQARRLEDKTTVQNKKQENSLRHIQERIHKMEAQMDHDQEERTRDLIKRLQLSMDELMRRYKSQNRTMQEKMRANNENQLHNLTEMTRYHDGQIHELEGKHRLDKEEQIHRHEEEIRLFQDRLRSSYEENSNNLTKLSHQHKEEIQQLEEKLQVDKKELVDNMEEQTRELREILQLNYNEHLNNQSIEYKYIKEGITELEQQQRVENEAQARELEDWYSAMKSMLRLDDNNKTRDPDEMEQLHKEKLEEVEEELRVSMDEILRRHNELTRNEEEQVRKLEDRIKHNNEELLNKLETNANEEDERIRKLEEQIHDIKNSKYKY